MITLLGYFISSNSIVYGGETQPWVIAALVIASITALSLIGVGLRLIHKSRHWSLIDGPHNEDEKVYITKNLSPGKLGLRRNALGQ